MTALAVISGASRWHVEVADALTWLRTLPAESVNCCVTSPPYWGLRDYGVSGQYGLEPTPEAWVTRQVAVFEEVRRVLRKDGTCWVNVGDAYVSGQGGRQSAVGELPPTLRRDRPAPKKRPELDNAPSGWAERAVAPRNYPGRETKLKPKDLLGLPWLLAFALRSAGWYLRQDIIWHKPNPMPESVTDRCTRGHEYIFMFSKSARYEYNADAIRTGLVYPNDVRSPNGAGQAATVEGRPASGTRSKYKTPDGWDTTKGEGGHVPVHRNGREKGQTDKQRGHGRRHAGFNDRWYDMERAEQIANGANARSVWTIPTEGYPGAHFATFPTALPRRCILAGCPTGGVVLDPYVGSGTTLAVAVDLGCRGIGSELNAEYAAMARKRIGAVTPSMFTEAQ